MIELSDENFLIFAAQHYQNPHCYSMKDFQVDLNHIRYLRTNIKKFHERNDLKERLILNHLIILSNLFGVRATVHMVVYKIDDKYMYILKSFLIHLGYIKDGEIIQGIDFSKIEESDEIRKALEE